MRRAHSQHPVAWGEIGKALDEARDGKGETAEGGFRTSLFKPAGVFVRW